MTKKSVRAIVEGYEERLAEKPNSRNLGRFLSIWPEVKELLDEGRSARVIWAALHDAGKISIKYSTFAGHIKNQINHAKTTTPGAETSQAGEARLTPPTPVRKPEVSSDKKKPVAPWGKPIERSQNTTAGQIPTFGIDQSEESYGKF